MNEFLDTLRIASTPYLITAAVLIFIGMLSNQWQQFLKDERGRWRR